MVFPHSLLALSRNRQTKIFEQNISGFDRTRSALHYSTQLVFTDSAFFGYPVSALASSLAARNLFSDGLDNHTGNHIFNVL